MPEKAIAAAKQLSDELHARGRRERVRNLVETGILIVVALLVGAILFNVVAGRADNSRRSAERKSQIDQLTAIAQKIDAVTDPNGCSAMRGQRNLARLLIQIDNNNRALLGKTLNPVPQEDKTLCAGEPGGPPLTTTTVPKKQARKVTGTTVRTALPRATQPLGSGSGT